LTVGNVNVGSVLIYGNVHVGSVYQYVVDYSTTRNVMTCQQDKESMVR
jgi:paraquat-inducible protein B